MKLRKYFDTIVEGLQENNTYSAEGLDSKSIQDSPISFFVFVVVNPAKPVVHRHYYISQVPVFLFENSHNSSAFQLRSGPEKRILAIK